MPVDARASWQSVPFAPAPVFSSDPLAWVETVDPTRVDASSHPTGGPVLEPLPVAGGWVLVQAEGHAPRRAAVPGGETELELRLAPSAEISVRADRPHLFVSVEVEGELAQWGRADASGEVWLHAPLGPAVARASFPLGARSYPVGLWPGFGPAAVRIDRTDEPGRPSGCVFGFVRGPEGEPVEGAVVFLQQGEALFRRAESDGSGFYRVEALAAGPYALMAQATGDPRAVRDIQTLELEADAGGAAAEVRRDLSLHAGVLVVEGAPEGEGVHVSLWTGDGDLVWSAAPGADGAVRVTGLAPGRYRVRAYTAAVEAGAAQEEGHALGEIEIGAGRPEPVRLRWSDG